jgi:Tol biopolymer transport system component/DNA-binding winged helix-turn-helix (wHTH) protein
MQPSPTTPRTVRFGIFELDLAAAEMRKRGRKVPLQEQPFKVLALLLRSPGGVVTREELQRALWPDDTFGDFDEGLNKAIQKLRQALEDSTDGPRFIETLPRKGYRFIAAVETIAEPTAAFSPESAGNGGKQPTAFARRREVLAWALFTIAFLALAAVAAVHFRQQPGEVHAVRFQIPVPNKADVLVELLEVSPNGRHVVFLGHGPDEKAQLWVHSLDSMTTRLLPGIKHPALPFWSPDSRFVAFFDVEQTGIYLRKINVTGGLPQTICDTRCVAFGGGTWNRDGVILFAKSTTGPGEHDSLFRVSAAGGEIQPVLPLDKARQEINQAFPRFLPDGRHFLYQSFYGTAEPNEMTYHASKTLSSGVFLGSLDSKETRMLVAADSNVSYVQPGFLIYGQGRTLVAQPFDANKFRLTGEPVPVADHVERGPDQSYVFSSASENDLLVFGNEASHDKQLAWYKRDGARLGPIGEPGKADSIVLSPDERQLALMRKYMDRVKCEVWICELSTGIFTRLTHGSDGDWAPVWSPDGRELAYGSDRGSSRLRVFDLYRQPAGGGEPELLFASDRGTKMPRQWLPDASLLYQTWAENSGDFYLLPLRGKRKPVLLLKTEFVKDFPYVSSDGRWVAYQSEESGRSEIYVAAFPSFNEKRQVSNGGGSQAKWRKDGKELFYVTVDGKMMSVEVRRGAKLETSAPRVLFQVPFRLEEREIEYAVTGDGQRFIFGEPVEASKWLNVVLNWTAGLKR